MYDKELLLDILEQIAEVIEIVQEQAVTVNMRYFKKG